MATIPYQLEYTSAQVEFLRQSGDEVILVSGAEPSAASKLEGHLTIPLTRRLNPTCDLKSIRSLHKILVDNDIDLVHSISPKAGLISAIAGYWAGTEVRLHTWTGQPWATMEHGIRRAAFKRIERLILRLNTRCFCDSHSQREYLVAEGIGKPAEIGVLAAGSLAGVDLSRFSGGQSVSEAASTIRNRHEIGVDDVLFLFVGRVTSEKGVPELLRAFERLAESFSDVHLIIAGPIDSDIGGGKVGRISDMKLPSRAHYVGATECPEHFYAASDVLCLPSYREGFGTVVIEAAAMEVPCVGSRIVGLRDAVVDGETGILVPPGDVASLAQALERLYLDGRLRSTMGRSAAKRAQSEFGSDRLADALRSSYAVMLAEVS